MTLSATARALVLGLGILPALAAGSTTPETLRFKVYLNQNPIGEHSFRLSPAPQGKRVLSQASFDVDILVFNAYRYRHESRELWRDGCLAQIRSTTDDNGKAYRVEGESAASALSIEVNGRPQDLPGCISTFAYWDRDFLKRSRLLNPQTGELVEVRAEPAGTERRSVAGREVEAERWRLRAEALDITLWYTPEGRWIGLESDTGKGRTLRYEPN
jgi:hypothetical protein